MELYKFEFIFWPKLRTCLKINCAYQVRFFLIKLMIRKYIYLYMHIAQCSDLHYFTHATLNIKNSIFVWLYLYEKVRLSHLYKKASLLLSSVSSNIFPAHFVSVIHIHTLKKKNYPYLSSFFVNIKDFTSFLEFHIH